MFLTRASQKVLSLKDSATWSRTETEHQVNVNCPVTSEVAVLVEANVGTTTPAETHIILKKVRIAILAS